MTSRAELIYAMESLFEALRSVSDITDVPVKTLVIAMLAAVKREDADMLLEAGKCFAPFSQAPVPAGAPVPDGASLVPTSASYENMLTLIQRDNPPLYKKLTGLD